MWALIVAQKPYFVQVLLWSRDPQTHKYTPHTHSHTERRVFCCEGLPGGLGEV